MEKSPSIRTSARTPLTKYFEQGGEIKMSNAINIGSRRELFWDEYLINTGKTTAELKLHQLQSKEVVIDHNEPWEGDGFNFHCNNKRLVRNRMWRVELVSMTFLLVASVFIMKPLVLATDTKNKDVETCAGNLKALYKALSLYCQEHDGILPPSTKWSTLVSKYLNRYEKSHFGIDYLQCPVAELTKKESSSYGVNYWFVFSYEVWGDKLGVSQRLADIPPTTFLCADSGLGTIYNPKYSTWKLVEDKDGDGAVDSSSAGLYNGFSPRHNGGANVLFADGTVKWVSLKDFLSNKDNLWGDCIRP